MPLRQVKPMGSQCVVADPFVPFGVTQFNKVVAIVSTLLYASPTSLSMILLRFPFVVALVFIRANFDDFYNQQLGTLHIII